MICMHVTGVGDIDQSYVCSVSSPKSGWAGVLAAARYGFADIVRELITKYGCDRNAVKDVSVALVKQDSSAAVPDVLL